VELGAVRITLGPTFARDDLAVSLRSIDWPFVVPLAPGPHYSLVAHSAEVAATYRQERLGWAVLLWRSRRRVVYWTPLRRSWSADCRRVERRLRLVGFVRVPQGLTIPGHPL
jgi:hypothetical protein